MTLKFKGIRNIMQFHVSSSVAPVVVSRLEPEPEPLPLPLPVLPVSGVCA